MLRYTGHEVDKIKYEAIIQNQDAGKIIRIFVA